MSLQNRITGWPHACATNSLLLELKRELHAGRFHLLQGRNATVWHLQAVGMSQPLGPCGVVDWQMMVDHKPHHRGPAGEAFKT